jgi:O-antigen ligase
MEKPSLRLILGAPHTGVLAWTVFWIALMGTAVVFSMSRMGIAALFCSVSAMTIMAKAAQSRMRATVIILILVFAILGMAVYVGVDEIFARFENLSESRESDVGRIALWQDAWKMIQAQPWYGTGLGTFQWTYPAYETVDPDTPARYAHNDYLQILAETGPIGLALMLWFFVALWQTAVKNLRDDKDPLVKGIGLGSIGVLSALALQEITDFGLYIPGVAVLAALLAGLNLRARSADSR